MEWLENAISAMAQWFPDGSFYASELHIYASLGILLACLVCGGVGGLVVGNRMAFFSDALSHCALAGVSLGFILCLTANISERNQEGMVTLIMVFFGVLVGLGIALVRERTGLASDTVIGVFFAFAMGLGAVLTSVFGKRMRFFNIESFIFGSPLGADAPDILLLAILLVATVVFLCFFYNDLVLASVHPSLALSRGVRVRLLRYLLIVLLGVLVNVCLKVVGALLVNSLLIVPAAAASNLSRNIRQTFWWTLALAVLAGLGGQWCSWEINNMMSHASIQGSVGIGGTIVSLCCVFFFASMALRPLLRGTRTAA